MRVYPLATCKMSAPDRTALRPGGSSELEQGCGDRVWVAIKDLQWTISLKIFRVTSASGTKLSPGGHRGDAHFSRCATASPSFGAQDVMLMSTEGYPNGQQSIRHRAPHYVRERLLHGGAHSYILTCGSLDWSSALHVTSVRQRCAAHQLVTL